SIERWGSAPGRDAAGGRRAGAWESLARLKRENRREQHDEGDHGDQPVPDDKAIAERPPPQMKAQKEEATQRGDKEEAQRESCATACADGRDGNQQDPESGCRKIAMERGDRGLGRGLPA